MSDVDDFTHDMESRRLMDAIEAVQKRDEPDLADLAKWGWMFGFLAGMVAHHPQIVDDIVETLEVPA
jgi:hypothetical protein